MDELITDS